MSQGRGQLCGMMVVRVVGSMDFSKWCLATRATSGQGSMSLLAGRPSRSTNFWHCGPSGVQHEETVLPSWPCLQSFGGFAAALLFLCVQVARGNKSRLIEQGGKDFPSLFSSQTRVQWENKMLGKKYISVCACLLQGHLLAQKFSLGSLDYIIYNPHDVVIVVLLISSGIEINLTGIRSERCCSRFCTVLEAFESLRRQSR